jgi:putative flippase GtrA
MQINCYIANAIAIAAVTGWNYFKNLKLSCRVTAPSAQTD